MSTFMENFNIFLQYFLQAIGNIYNWFIGTIIGQITIFIIIISIFIYIVYKIVGIGD